MTADKLKNLEKALDEIARQVPHGEFKVLFKTHNGEVTFLEEIIADRKNTVRL